jgi:hypothetical protein
MPSCDDTWTCRRRSNTYYVRIALYAGVLLALDKLGVFLTGEANPLAQHEPVPMTWHCNPRKWTATWIWGMHFHPQGFSLSLTHPPISTFLYPSLVAVLLYAALRYAAHKWPDGTEWLLTLVGELLLFLLSHHHAAAALRW